MVFSRALAATALTATSVPTAPDMGWLASTIAA